MRFEQPTSPFRAELTRRVDAHFGARSRHATVSAWAVGLLSLALTAGGWAALVFLSLPWWAAVPLALLTGFCIAQVGFNVGHDAIHGALSSRRWVNALFSRSFDPRAHFLAEAARLAALAADEPRRAALAARALGLAPDLVSRQLAGADDRLADGELTAAAHLAALARALNPRDLNAADLARRIDAAQREN